MNQLDFVADELLSGNDGEVLTKKRENFKKAVLAAIEEIKVWNSHAEYMIAENIVKKTFDEGIVN